MRELRKRSSGVLQHGRAVEEKLRQALLNAGATIKKATERERFRMDIVEKIDILLTSIPHLPEFHEPIAIQVTLNQRFSCKPQRFLQLSSLTSRRRIYLVIQRPDRTPINRQFAESLLAAIRTFWLEHEVMRNTFAVGITVREGHVFEIYKLEQRINQHIANVNSTVGVELRGRVIFYHTDKQFGFIDCIDNQLCSAEHEGYEFFFRFTDCGAAVASRLAAGDTHFLVRFTNGGFGESNARNSPLARELQSLTLRRSLNTVTAVTAPYPPTNRQALRQWMQQACREMHIAAAVTEPPLLEPEEQMAIERYRLHTLYIPQTIDPVIANGRPGYWVAVETYSLDEGNQNDPLVRLLAGRSRQSTTKANLEAGFVEWIAPHLGFRARHRVRLLTPVESRFLASVFGWLKERRGADLPDVSDAHPREWVRSDPGEYGIASPTEYLSGDDRATAPFHVLVELRDK